MKYEKIKYPDGQISVKLLGDVTDWDPDLMFKIGSYDDLFTLLSISEAAKATSRPLRKLNIPCLFGQRSDRRFQEFQSFDLKIVADIINVCGFQKVEIFDPHSDVSLALIHNSYKISSFNYVEQAFIQEGNPVIVSPDVGAYKKCFEYGQKLNCEVAAAVKHRDLNGKIDLIFIGNVIGKRCLIVDDLADGGYTFKVLAEELINQGAARVALYVSHGYFSKGFDELFKVIDHIYCTDSVKEIIQEGVTQYKLI